MIHLAIIDGSRLFADALAARLGSEPGLRVLRCSTGEAALRQALTHSSADVVVGDATLFDILIRPQDVTAGPVVADRNDVNRAPDQGPFRVVPALVLLADHGDAGRLTAALRAGARGWVSKDGTVSELVSAIREAAEGGTWIRPKVLTTVLDELLRPPSSPEDPRQRLLATLTAREREVLSCLVDGLGRLDVASRLQMSTNTVRTHVQSILSKLGVNSCVAAVALVRRAAEGDTVLRVLAQGPQGRVERTTSAAARMSPEHGGHAARHTAAHRALPPKHP